MNSIIEEIYYGKRGNMDSVDFGKAYWEAQKKGADMLEEMEKGFNDNQKKLLREIFWASAEQEAEAIKSFYTEGFKVGFLLAVECFTK